jgi:ataxia telangiectasia mutated family protein
MCKEHPFHSLYQVYCLLPERSIPDSSRRQSGRLSAPTMPSTQTERSSAAQVVFDKLRADTAVQDKVTEVEKLCNACRQWAKYPLMKERYGRPGHPYPIPSELLICRLPALRVPVPTLPLPLDPTMRYDNCVCVDSFEKQFETAGGKSLPKISSCKGSNGKTYKQLVRHAASSTSFFFLALCS